MQRNELHTVHDRVGVTERMPLAGLDVRHCDRLGTLEELLRILRQLSVGRSPAPDHDAAVRRPELRSDRRPGWPVLPEQLQRSASRFSQARFYCQQMVN